MATQPESGSIAQEFAALLGYLQRNGCGFRSCLALDATPRGVAFRYDIHRRDLPAAHDFLALHLRVGIPATFFLLWDYSPLERKRLDQFLGFAAKAKAPVEIGLHDSPVDAWLIESDFAGDRKAYVVWTQSAALPEWLAGLVARPDELAAFHAQVLERFVARVERTRQLFGPVAAVASHGGQLGQRLRRDAERLAPDIAALLRSLVARGWLTPERIAAAGLAADVENYGHDRTQVSDGGGKLVAMAGKLRDALAQDRAIQILLHPYTWDGAERDAELSALLKEN